MKKDPVANIILLMAERDYLDWKLRLMWEQTKRRTPIERMIDDSTGYDKRQLSAAKKMIKRIEKICSILGDAPANPQHHD